MTPIAHLRSIAIPLIRDNIDTDAIIPSREIKAVGKTGLADGLFAGLRYRAIGGRDPDPDFVLNDPAYRGAQILLAGRNFGCGSSREHAAWALAEYGIRAIVAASFNPIFHGNCVRNGMVPVELDAARLWDAMGRRPGALSLDLAAQTLSTASGFATHFPIDAESKAMLLQGLDMIDLTLQRAAEIAAFRDRDRDIRPWAYLHSGRAA